MSVTEILDQYGLIGAFLCCLLEGEGSAMAGGALAHQKIPVMWQVVIAVFGGAYLNDIGWFFAGRKLKSTSWVERRRQKHAGSHTAKGVAQNPYWSRFCLLYSGVARIEYRDRDRLPSGNINGGLSHSLAISGSPSNSDPVVEWLTKHFTCPNWHSAPMP